MQLSNCLMKNFKQVYLLATIIFFSSIFNPQGGCAQKKLNLLVITKTNGFRHKSIDIGKEKLTEWGKAEKWKVTFSEDSTIVNDKVLGKTDVLVFLNSSGDILGSNERQSLVKFMKDGGSFVGVHCATCTEKEWPWFRQMIGARFDSHPKVQMARMAVNHEYAHPAINHLGDSLKMVDEWYNFQESVVSHAKVLLTLDESSYNGKKMDEEHPIAWFHDFEAGRVFYTGIGHTNETYQNEEFKKHLIGGINWAGRRLNLDEK
ncbi:MAG: ThuA domain-containing protein [Cyclobacteriaceae bacterium]